MAAADAKGCLLLPDELNADAQQAHLLWGVWCTHDGSCSGLCACQPSLTGSVVQALAEPTRGPSGRLPVRCSAAAGAGFLQAVVHPCAAAHEAPDCWHELPDMRNRCPA